MPDLVSIARAALLEVTPEATIGAPTGTVDEAGATTVTFQANMSGYPGWHWTVSVATLEGEDPSVLEVELMPGDGALLAPDWVPWSERLADYEAAQEALAADAEADDDDSVDDSDDDDDDDLGSDVLHGGDLDGVDIDDPDEELDEDDEDLGDEDDDLEVIDDDEVDLDDDRTY
jgi:hypothetical protein